MEQKETTQMMQAYKELAYSRRATLMAIQEILYDSRTPPEEAIERSKSILIACGYKHWEEGQK